jgi:hypothetical protein
MTKYYKVWVEIEEIDEDNDIFETIDCCGAEEFDNLEDAQTYAAHLCRS